MNDTDLLSNSYRRKLKIPNCLYTMSVMVLRYTVTMQIVGLDEDGFIASEVSKEKIMPEYGAVIEAAITCITNGLPDLVHSAYVYGSVARGNPVRGKSDLDLLVVFRTKLTDAERHKLNDTLEELSKEYGTLVREVGVADCTYDELLDPKNKHGWGAYLKILCVCVFGDDLTERFGKFRPSADIAIGFNGDIQASLATALEKIKDASSDAEAGKVAATFARKLIRTCYSMVIERSQVWTTKMNEQTDLFVKYFPDKKDFLVTLQDWVEQAPQDKTTILAVLEHSGQWVADNFVIEARKTK